MTSSVKKAMANPKARSKYTNNMELGMAKQGADAKNANVKMLMERMRAKLIQECKEEKE